MPNRLLTEVERGKRQPERADAAKDVGEAARGDQRVSGRDERAMAEEQRRREVIDVVERTPGIVGVNGLVLDPGCGAGARRAEARSDIAE